MSHLTINPRWEHVPGFVKGFHESSHYYGWPRDTQYIDLRSSESDLLAQMKPKGRYNIGVARRHGVSVFEDTSREGIEEFVDLYRDTHIRKNIGRVESEYFRTFVPTVASSGLGSMFFATYQNIRIAAAIVVYFGHTEMYYYGGSRSVRRNVMAPYLLHFEIMRKVKALGCQYYDFGGVAPQSAPDDRWTDFSVFKRKFGGREVRFVPTLEYVYDPAAYQEWEALKRGRRNDQQGGHGESHLGATQA